VPKAYISSNINTVREDHSRRANDNKLDNLRSTTRHFGLLPLIVSCSLLTCVCCTTLGSDVPISELDFYGHLYQLFNSPDPRDRYTAYQTVPFFVATDEMESRLKERLSKTSDPVDKVLIGYALYSIQSSPEYEEIIVTNYPEGKGQVLISGLYAQTSYLRQFPGVMDQMAEFAVTNELAARKLFSAVGVADGWWAELLSEACTSILVDNSQLFLQVVSSEDADRRQMIYEMSCTALSEVQKRKVLDQLESMTTTGLESVIRELRSRMTNQKW
jgi:hypothetical protein